jgi:hypothetical protein
MKLLLAAMLVAVPVFAQVQNPQLQVATALKVKFVPPPELGARPNHPAASADNAYTLRVTVSGVNASSKQPWSVTMPARSYAITAPRDAVSGNATGRRAYKPVRFTFHKSSLQDGVLGAAVAREDRITLVKFDFKPVKEGPTHYVATHELGHASLEGVDEYVEAAFPTYQKITWSWIDGAITQTDQWTVPPPK